MKSHKLEHSKAIDFLLGGKSIFKFVNTKTENRFTFKVKKHKTDDVFFVSVLTNPEVYQFIGSLKNKSFTHLGNLRYLKMLNLLEFLIMFFQICVKVHYQSSLKFGMKVSVVNVVEL